MAPGAGDGAPSERKPKAKRQPRAEGSKAGARSTPKRPGSGRRPASAGSGAPGSGKKRVKKKLTICLSGCKYDLISRITEELGYRTVEEEEPWNLQWIDTSVSIERVMRMKKFQKINHFPGMAEISRKDFLAKNLTRMQKMFSEEYSYFPATFALPQEANLLRDFCRSKKGKTKLTLIVKPSVGCQGKGIYLATTCDKINMSEPVVVQTYVRNPLLIDGLKFDLRIYVLVTSCTPLRMFIFKEGLARFATKPYVKPNESNISNTFMHLTNYSLNKHSDDFVPAATADEGEGPADEAQSSKRTIEWVMNWLRENGHNADLCWERIGVMLNKTLIAIQPKLAHAYRTCFSDGDSDNNCFEILGFDVLLDASLKPWLIEVNHSPSFNTDSPLDEVCKSQLVTDTLRLVGIKASSKRNYSKQLRKEFAARNLKERRGSGHGVAAARLGAKAMRTNRGGAEEATAKLLAFEEKHRGGYTRIYPPLEEDQAGREAGDEIPYQRFFAGATMIFTGEFRGSEDREMTSERILRMCAQSSGSAAGEDSGEDDSENLEDLDALLRQVEPRLGVGGRLKLRERHEPVEARLMNASMASPGSGRDQVEPLGTTIDHCEQVRARRGSSPVGLVGGGVRRQSGPPPARRRNTEPRVRLGRASVGGATAAASVQQQAASRQALLVRAHGCASSDTFASSALMHLRCSGAGPRQRVGAASRPGLVRQLNTGRCNAKQKIELKEFCVRRRTGEEGTESQLVAQPPAKEHSTVPPPAAGNVVAQRRPVDLPEVGGRAPSSMMARTKAAAASLIGAQKHLAATELRMRISAARGGVAGDGASGQHSQPSVGGVCGRSAAHQRAALPLSRLSLGGGGGNMYVAPARLGAPATVRASASAGDPGAVGGWKIPSQYN